MLFGFQHRNEIVEELGEIFYQHYYEDEEEEEEEDTEEQLPFLTLRESNQNFIGPGAILAARIEGGGSFTPSFKWFNQ